MSSDKPKRVHPVDLGYGVEEEAKHRNDDAARTRAGVLRRGAQIGKVSWAMALAGTMRATAALFMPRNSSPDP
ncbi:MAG: hypothetical protein H0T78_07725 [Longispora sp.]|nr:hypothetical protein [Longispora sp. (in: high G+C Gram-positive bacteria)]